MLFDGRYQVVKKLSAGGFGITYLVKDTRRPGQPICVAKELHPQHQNNPKIVRLFEQEAEMLEVLGRHDQIPRLLAAFQESNRWYLVQEFVEGITLADELQPPTGNTQCKSEIDVIALLRDVLTVLAFVHEQNVVHRDIKPANLICRQEDGKMVLIDFGAVKALTNSQVNHQGQITTTVSIGTPGYSPLEQFAQGNPRLSSDIYALGMTAITALTGVAPSALVTSSTTLEVIWQKYCRVSPALAAFLTQMVRQHFSLRFRDAGVALKALESFASPAPNSVPTSVIAARQTPPVTQPSVPKPPAPTPASPPRSPAPSQKKPNPVVPVAAAPLVKPRRDVLKFLGFSAAGVLVTLGGQQLLRGGQGSSESNSAGLAPEDEPTLEPVADNSPAAVEPTPVPAPIATPAEQQLETLDFKTVQVNAQGQTIAEPTGQAQYFDEPYLLGKLGDALPLRMVRIPAGEFMVGSPESEVDRDDDEGPQRRVSVPSFFMGAFAITQRQYTEVMGNNPARFTEDGANRPVEKVSWLDAEAFCQKLSELTGTAYRLPSEAEWEYACRAGTTTPFAFSETLNTDMANYDGNYTYGSGPKGAYREQTVAANTFAPNAFGLYNMHGNVYEWCADDYQDSYNGMPNDASPRLTGDSDAWKVLRGGSWNNNPRNCRSANRDNLTRGNRNNNVGFRVLCVLSP